VYVIFILLQKTGNSVPVAQLGGQNGLRGPRPPPPPPPPGSGVPV